MSTHPQHINRNLDYEQRNAEEKARTDVLARKPVIIRGRHHYPSAVHELRCYDAGYRAETATDPNRGNILDLHPLGGAA